MTRAAISSSSAMVKVDYELDSGATNDYDGAAWPFENGGCPMPFDDPPANPDFSFTCATVFC
jgi:hypothetical protein